MHQVAYTFIADQVDDHADSRVQIIQDLFIRDIDPQIKDQMCTMYF